MIIGHFADWHLRDTQYTNKKRGEDFFQAVLNAIEAASLEGIRYLVAAGDLFNVSRPSPNCIQQMMQIDQKARELRLTILGTTGNHDMAAPTWLETLFPGRTAESYGIVPSDNKVWEISTGNPKHKPLKIAGLPYLNKGRFLADVEAENLPEADVLIFHGLVQEFLPVPLENCLSIEDFPTENYQVIMLGDVHINDIRQVDGCLIGYPGSTEMCDRSEDTQKYIATYHYDGQKLTQSENISFKTTPYLATTVLDQNDLEKVLAFAKENSGEGRRVTYNLHYSQEAVPDFLPRFYGAVDPTRDVVKLLPLPKGQKEPRDIRYTADTELMGLADFAQSQFSDHKELCELAVAICNDPSADYSVMFSDYIDSRQKALNPEL